MAHARVSPRVGGARRGRRTRVGDSPGSGLVRYRVSRCGRRGGAFRVSPVSMTFEPVALAAAVNAARALGIGLSGLARVVCLPAMGAV